MENNFLTIIIPAYNAEKTIEKCVRSIFEIPNVSVCVVDDGSNDATFDILKKLSKEYGSLKIVKQDNSGTSCARNKGLLYVNTPYVSFCDADDYFDNVEAFREIDFDYELNVYPFVTIGKVDYTDYDLLEESCVYSAKEYFCEMDKYFYSLFFGVVWNKVYKTDIIKKRKLFFPENVTIGEDSIFNLNYIKNIKKIKINKNKYYCHVLAGNSLSVTVDELQRYSDLLERLDVLKNVGKSFGVDVEQNYHTRRAVGLISAVHYIVGKYPKCTALGLLSQVCGRMDIVNSLEQYDGDSLTIKVIKRYSKKRKWKILYYFILLKKMLDRIKRKEK